MASLTSTTVHWLGQRPRRNPGITFAVPWPSKKVDAESTSFSCTDERGYHTPLQTRPLAYWPDGSAKWTSHAIPASAETGKSYTITADSSNKSHHEFSTKLHVQETTESVTVSTGKVEAVFPKAGQAVIQSIRNNKDNCVGAHVRLVLLSQTGISDPDKPDPSVTHHQFLGCVENAVVEQAGPVRAVIAVSGFHQPPLTGDANDGVRVHRSWIPFNLRFYLFSGSESIRVVHTITHDGDSDDFIRGIGLRIKVPLADEAPYDRHVRFTESSDPGQQVRQAQVEGKPLPDPSTWDAELPPASLRWVPVWNDYSLHQLSSDGFKLEKRLREGHAWIKTASGTRAGGLVYVGGANRGGLALGSRHFWERYPTRIDVRGLGTQDDTEVTLWLYDPKAGPMDLRPYHDGLGQENYDDQLDALKVTYEDWEPGLGSPYGIARTNELVISASHLFPDSITLSTVAENLRDPPRLIPTPDAIHESGVFGSIWSPKTHIGPKTLADVDERLDFLFYFYKSQVEQRRWYGFWDHGDIMHSYDADRHTWKYDIGGYAWDNSELSPDLWRWLFFLRTGRPDVFQLAEALTRHTGEVDVYHLGVYRGLGTRHGVQHWSDSCKQARISNALYRRYFYYLSGGDERVGDLLEETLETGQRFLALDPYRKVRKDRNTYKRDPRAVEISLGTDWAALAASWLIEFERRGSRSVEAKEKLTRSIEGIGKLTNGFVTGNVTYDPATGDIAPPASDPENKGVVRVSHLSAMFGLFEVAAEMLQIFPREAEQTGFRAAWLDYCVFFSSSREEQEARYGKPGWGRLQLCQGHSRLTAFAARELERPDLAARALAEFHTGDEFRDFGLDAPWKSVPVGKDHVLEPTDEAPWVSTNIAALYGLAGIQKLALLETGSGQVQEMSQQ
ncbi:Uncharacterized protein C8035_v001857 [Colletotrichum spinosum]|uniref:Tat pathway signal sequence domain protein n=1 Tax=Colletotrichum spinosum TaxID=1347390 RepID=A0A4R8Q091_9PEZI|nr:Uncharacterized protein C8035_v001857 [Colletotrichum spinosum]